MVCEKNLCKFRANESFCSSIAPNLHRRLDVYPSQLNYYSQFRTQNSKLIQLLLYGYCRIIIRNGRDLPACAA